mmetsp:Transcript_4351/g.6524  ORF Transcript_4351/g.6524 Transcript_4351/m.6524 type:complete len:271 (+) Transcript_4351:1-813(+)
MPKNRSFLFSTRQNFFQQSLFNNVIVLPEFENNRLVRQQRYYAPPTVKISESVFRKKGKKKGGKGGKKNNDDQVPSQDVSDAIESLQSGEFFDQIEQKMAKSCEFLDAELSQIRSRASPAMLESIQVKAYGDEDVPLSKLALVTQKDANALRVAAYDANVLPAIEKAILESENDLGLAPQRDGAQLHVPVPKVTTEMRQALIKQASNKCEQSKVVMRSIRQKAMGSIKRHAKVLSKPEVQAFEKKVQSITDQYTKAIEQKKKVKERDLTN